MARLRSFSNAAVLTDGSVSFRIETDEGPGDIVCSVPELGDAISYLVALAAGHAEHFATESRPESQPYLSVIPAKGIGFQEGRTANTMLVVMQTPGIALGFEVENSALAALADDIARIARTLSADRSKPN